MEYVGLFKILPEQLKRAKTDGIGVTNGIFHTREAAAANAVSVCATKP